MRWAQRLKRVFKLDLATCDGGGGRVRVIARIEDPAVIGRILDHLARRRVGLPGEQLRPAVRGPPSGGLDCG